MESIQYECDACVKKKTIDQFLIAFDIDSETWTGIYCIDCIGYCKKEYMNHRFFALMATSPPQFIS
jgi:hypothetical protein